MSTSLQSDLENHFDVQNEKHFEKQLRKEFIKKV